MADNTISVQPPPYQSPMTDKSGAISGPWINWIRQVYLRIGGASAPSPTGIASDIATLQSNVGVLETDIAVLQPEMVAVTNLADALSVGRQL